MGTSTRITLIVFNVNEEITNRLLIDGLLLRVFSELVGMGELVELAEGGLEVGLLLGINSSICGSIANDL